MEKLNSMLTRSHQWIYQKLGIPWIFYLPIFIVWIVFGGKSMVHLMTLYPEYWFSFDLLFSMISASIIMVLICNTHKKV